jgi:hypothetical protein
MYKIKCMDKGKVWTSVQRGLSLLGKDDQSSEKKHKTEE